MQGGREKSGRGSRGRGKVGGRKDVLGAKNETDLARVTSMEVEMEGRKEAFWVKGR